MSVKTVTGITAAIAGLAFFSAQAAEKSYDLAEFNRIEINSGANIDIRVGKKQAVKVEAEDDVLDHMDLEVSGKTLEINQKRRLFSSWSGAQPKITIRVKDLRDLEINGSADGTVSGLRGKSFFLELNGSGTLELSGDVEQFGIELNGAGDITARKLRTRNVDVEINGSGDVAFSGKCKSLSLEINGSGEFDGKELKCEAGDVEIMGSGDASVYASDMLRVEIIGSGDVEVYGKPEKLLKEVRRKSQVVIKD